MNLAFAIALFKDIHNPDFSDLYKGRAIQLVLSAATHNSITKDDMLQVIRWLWDMVFEEAPSD